MDLRRRATDLRHRTSKVAVAARARLDTLDVARWGDRLRVVVFALVGATLALALFGRVAAEVGPFQTTVTARPSLTGETVARLAPLGQIHVDTHSWPLSLELRIDQLGFEEAELIAENPERIEDLGDDVADEVAAAFRDLALRCALLAVIGGALGALASRMHWQTALAGAGTGIALTVLAIGGTVATFNVNAVSEPRYSGLLTMAPRAVGDVESIIERYGEYRSQLADLVGNVVTLYIAAEGLPTVDLGDDTIRVLHVSDLHLSFHALDFMDRLVDQFDIDVIADTGDTTDWGTSVEDRFVQELDRFDVPYVWVRGNHDSRGTERAIAALPDTVVLDGEAVTVAGLRFWGIGDPRYTPDKDQPHTAADQRDRAEAFAPEAAASLAASRPPADVALVHDPRIAAEMGGEVPLILGGHTHRATESRLGDDDETVLLVEGSTGGAGLRGLQGEEPTPLTATVLYFDPTTRLVVAYDRVSIEGLGGVATIERRVLFEEADEDAEDAGDEDGSDEDFDDTADEDPEDDD